MDVPSSKELRQLSYVELKRYARKQGLKKSNMKTEKLITAILSIRGKDDELVESSSIACDESRETSLNENKSWSEDSEIEIKTPMQTLKRAGTFSVEAPITPMEKQPKLDDATEVSVKNQHNKWSETVSKKVQISDTSKNLVLDIKENVNITKDQNNVVSAHQPAVTRAKTPRKSILRHSKRRYSGNKSKPSTENSREPITNGNKVNFITPDISILRRSNFTSDTPLRSVKDRPKTPVAVRSSQKRKCAFSPAAEKSPKVSKMVNGQFTPKFLNDTFPETSTPFPAGTKQDKRLQSDIPVAESAEKNPVASVTRVLRRKEITPSVSAKKSSASEVRKVQTPNFKEIHQRAFDKMETLEEYHERQKIRIHTLTGSKKITRNEISCTEVQYSSKKGNTQKKQNFTEKFKLQKSKATSVKSSRIPQPVKVIPFIPVVKSVRKINTNFTAQAQPGNLEHSSKGLANKIGNPSKTCQRTLFPSEPDRSVFQFGKGQVTENYSLVGTENKRNTQKKFDLKVSLSKKLPYKPYRGALRPLADANSNNVKSSYVDPIKEKRAQSREVLKGVRKNRRFELQMSRRGIV